MSCGRTPKHLGASRPSIRLRPLPDPHVIHSHGRRDLVRATDARIDGQIEDQVLRSGRDLGRVSPLLDPVVIKGDRSGLPVDGEGVPSSGVGLGAAPAIAGTVVLRTVVVVTRLATQPLQDVTLPVLGPSETIQPKGRPVGDGPASPSGYPDPRFGYSIGEIELRVGVHHSTCVGAGDTAAGLLTGHGRQAQLA